MHQFGFRSWGISPILFAFTLIILSPGRADAQTSYLYIGAGYTNADTEVAGGQVNLTAALGRRLEFGPAYLASELQLAVRGATRGELSAVTAQLEDCRLTNASADIPLMLGIASRRGRRPYIQAGPCAGIRGDSRTRFRVVSDHPGNINLERSMHRFDYGLIGGASVMIDTRFYRLGIEVRGQAGTTTVSEELMPGPMRSVSLVMGVAL